MIKSIKCFSHNYLQVTIKRLTGNKIEKGQEPRREQRRDPEGDRSRNGEGQRQTNTPNTGEEENHHRARERTLEGAGTGETHKLRQDLGNGMNPGV